MTGQSWGGGEESAACTQLISLLHRTSSKQLTGSLPPPPNGLKEGKAVPGNAHSSGKVLVVSW